MGKKDPIDEIPFTEETIKDRDLILKLLRYENEIILGEDGKKIYTDLTYKPRTSLFPEYTIHRKVLSNFGFDTSDESVENYRKIFSFYYQSPTEFDKEVLDSVVYMRENKCVYYTSPIINVGDVIPDTSIYQLDGTTKTTIKEELGTDL
jgi:hypothetical protein